MKLRKLAFGMAFARGLRSISTNATASRIGSIVVIPTRCITHTHAIVRSWFPLALLQYWSANRNRGLALAVGFSQPYYCQVYITPGSKNTCWLMVHNGRNDRRYPVESTNKITSWIWCGLVLVVTIRTIDSSDLHEDRCRCFTKSCAQQQLGGVLSGDDHCDNGEPIIELTCALCTVSF